MNRLISALAFLLFLGSGLAWSQDDKQDKPKKGDDDKYRPENGKEDTDDLTPEEALRLLKEAQALMLKTEELLNESSRGKALETEEELISKLKKLLTDEEKKDPAILQKKILEKIQKLLAQSEKKEQDTIDKLNEIIRRAKSSSSQSQQQKRQQQDQQKKQQNRPKNPSNPATEPYDPNRTDNPSIFRSKADRTRQWGDLPERVRQQMLHDSRDLDRYPKEYKTLIEEYMRKIAQDDK